MYQPKIRDEYIYELYRLKRQRKQPMTKILDEILDKYFESLVEEKKKQEKKLGKKVLRYAAIRLLKKQAENNEIKGVANNEKDEKGNTTDI